MSFQVSAIPSGHVRNVLQEILPYLDKAAAVTNGRMVTDDIIADIVNGACILWIAFDANDNNKIYGVVLAKITTYTRKRMLTVSFCAGERLSEWYDQMMALLFRFGKDQRCEGMEFTGRRGWERFLGKYGLKIKYHLFEVAIEE